MAAELERRWEAALRELKEAEERLRHEQQQPRAPEAARVPRNETPSSGPGETIPELWRQDRLSPQQKKAFLRCLIDKVVVHRSRSGHACTSASSGGEARRRPHDSPVTVGSLARLSSAEEMEKEILELADQGKTDEEIAALLTRARVSLSQAPDRPAQHRPDPSPAPPPAPRAQPIASAAHPRLPDRVRRSPGAWGSRRTGSTTGFTTAQSRWPSTPRRKLYLFPDSPETITLFKQLRAGKLQKLRF